MRVVGPGLQAIECAFTYENRSSSISTKKQNKNRLMLTLDMYMLQWFDTK
jgi:hypothetical protein